jgi:hypothetical protein
VIPETAHQLEHLAQALFVANVITDEIRGAHDVMLLILSEALCYFNQRNVVRLPTSATLDAEVAYKKASYHRLAASTKDPWFLFGACEFMRQVHSL